MDKRRLSMMRPSFIFTVMCLSFRLDICQARGRNLQQSYASAVSVSGGSGPYGNCGATETIGNAAVSLPVRTF